MLKTKYYGHLGGTFTPKVLVSTISKLVKAFENAKKDPLFGVSLKKSFQNTLAGQPLLPLPKT